MQSKLRDQAQSLANRMKARQLKARAILSRASSTDMEKAVEAMGPATEKLKGAKWQDALPPSRRRCST